MTIYLFGMQLLWDLMKLLGKVYFLKLVPRICFFPNIFFENKFKGGIYSLRLTFTPEYPSKPPREVRFTTEMFHPNIYADGSLCLDIIQDKWSPSYTVCSLLTSIQVINKKIFNKNQNFFISILLCF